VPHPAYRFNEVPSDDAPSDDVFYFGSVVPYKHLERLITAWNRTSRLVIAGGCGNPAYLASLKDLARDKNIEFNCGRISDEDAQRLLRGAAAAVIPHAGADMIVSGSLYFALSCGVPVICCGLQHARQLEQEDMPGVICLDRPEDINAVDTARLQRMDRHEIAGAVHSRFGTEAVARSISQVL
jgi:glycosyltransferase involved in cell wall biosynthesis